MNLSQTMQTPRDQRPWAMPRLHPVALSLVLLVVAAGQARADESGWTACAGELGHCAFSGTRYVRYGVDGNYVTRLFGDGVACTNEAFGRDPHPGLAKACWFADALPTWVRCAREGARCAFSGVRDVRYGQNDSFTYKLPTRSLECSNEAFGTDPLSGTGKTCWYALTPPSYQPCADERSRCNFEGTKQVRYGANGAFVYRTATGGIQCTNEAFGSDPLRGIGKKCWVGDDEANAPAASTYLSTSGMRLMRNGAVYRTVGFNAAGMAGCLDGGVAYSDAMLDAYFTSLRPGSLTRTWAFLGTDTAILDRIVAAAERHDQLLILSLADGAGFCGESDGRSGGEGTHKTFAWYDGGYRNAYLPWVETVAWRYRRSSGIGMWELINEPRGDSEDDLIVTDAMMRAFFDESAETLKRIDPIHLVESGTLAEYGEGTADYVLVHGGPDIDVASVHEYDYDWEMSREILSHQVTAVWNQMESLNKPVIVGETGIGSAPDAACSFTSITRRAEDFEKKYDAYMELGISAVMVWNWAATGPRDDCASFTVHPDDPLVPLTRNYVIR